MADFIKRFIRLLQFIPYYAWLVVVSNLLVIRDVVTRKKYATPAIIKMPCSITRDFEFLMLANLISMTPGTVSLDVSPDRDFLFVHVMFYDEEDHGKDVRHDIMELEKRIARIFE